MMEIQWPSRSRTRFPWPALCLALGLAALAAASARAQPDLRPLELGPGGVRLSWLDEGTSSRSYTVQSRGPAADALWLLPPASFAWPTADREWLDARPQADARFYRVLAFPAAQRGKVLASSLLTNYTTVQLTLIFAFAGIPLTPQHPINIAKVMYETVDPLGAPTVASGVVAWPRTAGANWPLVTYQHGTLAKKSEAPSADFFGEQLVGAAFATSGYVAVLPDYLGLGDSPGVPPYHVARSQGTAAVDMLRAARAYCASSNITLGARLFLCGYSQGGFAAMALLREIEQHHAAEFTVTAAATMAGAYDLSGVTTEDFLSDRPKPNPYYSALLLAALQDVYGLAPSLADLLAPPYDQTLPPLLDGQHTGEEINAAMPAQPSNTFKPEYLAAFRAHPDHPLRQALRDNDLIDWRPLSALRLYHCDQDQDVIIANSQVALARFHAAGATQVQLENPAPGEDHSGCSVPSLAAAKAWFDSLR